MHASLLSSRLSVCSRLLFFLFFFFFNDTATTEIYTLSLHDALPISCEPLTAVVEILVGPPLLTVDDGDARSEEHTSELQSRLHLVCRLLLEKKKKKTPKILTHSSHSSIARPSPQQTRSSSPIRSTSY